MKTPCNLVFGLRAIMYLHLMVFLLLNQKASAQINTFDFSGKVPDKPMTGYLQKGSRYVGLNGIGTYSNSSDFSTGSWSVTTQGGYFVANRFVAGVQLSYGKVSQALKANTSYVVPTYKIVTWAPELFGRYYITSLKVKPLLQFSTGYSFQGSRGEISGLPEFKLSNQFIANGAVGISYFFSKSIAAELTYNRRLTDSQKFDANTSTKIRLGVAIFLD